MNSKRICIAFLLAGVIGSSFLVFDRVEAQTAITTISGKFYKLEILSQNGQGGVGTIGSASSVNDSGIIAFTSSSGLYIADGRNPLRNIWVSSAFSRSQLNNQNQIISQRLDTATGSLRIERFDTTTVPAPPPTLIATNAVGAPFGQLNNPGLNNLNQAVFSAVQGSNAQLVTGTVGAYNVQNIANTTLNDLAPVVANNGSVVTRVGTNFTPANQAIRLYPNYNLSGTPVTIASVGADYTRLGLRPGMSDDGAIVVFYGESPGGIPGIFASFDVSGTRRTVRIARRQVERSTSAGGNSDGVCDAGETNCIDGFWMLPGVHCFLILLNLTQESV